MSAAEPKLPHRNLGDVDRQRPRLRDDPRRLRTPS
jgi:hypothetical protein